MFIEKFHTLVSEGDFIRAKTDGFRISARIELDDWFETPDERDDGFWPSLYKGSPGFIGAGNDWRARFDAAQARAEDIMRAWKAGEWFYCGIILSVSFEGVVLDEEAASLWGIEANYPDRDNSYLSEVANELLPEALNAGRAAAERICAALKPEATA